MTTKAERERALAQRERVRQEAFDRDEAFEVRVLAFLVGTFDGSAHLGALLTHFGSCDELDAALDRLVGRRQVDRFDGLYFHVTESGRARVGARSLAASSGG